MATLYEHFGVETIFSENAITLKKVQQSTKESLKIDLKNAPDIAQTIAVSCFAEGIACELSGLHTLKIKETDRLEALYDELSKFGANITITENSLSIGISSLPLEGLVKAIKTYNDHRMAMAFAPLALKVPIKILNAEVVTKSYQKFWEDMQQVGINVNEIV